LLISALFLFFTGHWRNPCLALTEPFGSAEPWLKNTEYLGNGDATLLRKLLLHFFTWVRVTQVRVEIFIKNFCCRLAKVAPLATVTNRTSELKVVQTEKSSWKKLQTYTKQT